MQGEKGFSGGIGGGLIARQLRPSPGWLAHGEEIAPSGVDLIRGRAGPNEAEQPECSIFSRDRTRPEEPPARPQNTCLVGHVQTDGTYGSGSSGEHAARMRRAGNGCDPVTVALPFNQGSRVNGSGQIRRETGRVGGHQEVAVVGCRIVERGGLNGIVEGRWVAQRTECLRLGGTEGWGLDA